MLGFITTFLFGVKRIGKQTADTTSYAMSHGKAVRRLILLFVSLVWLWMMQVAVRMYVTTTTLDGNFTNLCIAVTTMTGACYAFYFSGRSSEPTEPIPNLEDCS